MKSLLAVLSTLLLVGCSMNKVTGPVLRDHAAGTPQEGGGGEEGGGGGGATVNLGDTFNAEVSDEFNVPVYINGMPGENKGFQATLSVSGGLTVTGASAGPYLVDNGGPNMIFWRDSTSPGYQVLIGSLGPGYCGSAGYGTLFYLRVRCDAEGEQHVTLVSSPPGSGTPSPYYTNCSNQSQSVTYGNTNTTINVVNP